MEQDTLRHHARMPRRELWRIGDDGTYEDFLDRLPTFVRVKNDLLRCTMNHVDREEDSLAAKYHEMYCIMTKCGTASGGTCRCRYNILACEEVDFKSVFDQENHAMTDDAPDSAVDPKLTGDMKTYILA
ncbi:hypothetical protein GQ600_10258 [Phytophthora cactorum]|nr:hypothetical protein GQ600_10258 [Phytophthora cactorum]